MADPEGKTDKSPKWEEDHPNPSGIPDREPLLHTFNDETHVLRKVAQPIPEEHHEEGHTSE